MLEPIRKRGLTPFPDILKTKPGSTNSMRDLLAELNTAIDKGYACVYCSIIETRGSTPQKAGAAMLVFPDGSQRGTLGGGCVEAEVKQRALRVLHTQVDKPEVLTFCLDDNYGWDDGLICGGRMSILADPVIPAISSTVSRRYPIADNYYRCLRRLVEKGLGCTEAVVLNEQSAETRVGERYLFDHEGKLA